jgi:hypothetical protein
MIQEENNPLNISETEEFNNTTSLIKVISENEELGMSAVERIDEIISKYNTANDNNLSQDKKPEVLQEAQELKDELLEETDQHYLIDLLFLDLEQNYLCSTPNADL